MEDGTVFEGITAQTQQAFAHIKTTLDEAGVNFSYTVEMTPYHVGLNNHLEEQLPYSC